MTRPIVKKPCRGIKIFYPRFALSSNPVNSHWCLVECGKQLHRLKTFFVVFQPITLLTCATVFFCRRNHFALISKARISTDFKCSACSLTSQMPFCSSFPPFVFSPCHWSRKNYSYQALFTQRVPCLFLADVFDETDRISLWLEHIIKDYYEISLL